jgi:hypothetical protein
VTEQLDGTPSPKRPSTLRAWALDWLGERSLEYPLDKPKKGEKRVELPIDDCTDAALPDMPVRFQDEARRGALRAVFTRIAGGLGMRSIAKTQSGGSIYGYVRDLETLFDLWRYLRPLQRDVDGRQAAIALLVKEWLDAHPDEGVTTDDVLQMLDKDEPPEGFAEAG